MATERRLTAAALLRVWESGLRQRPVERALTILAIACPDVPRDRLAALSVGRRDAAMLTVRRETFGPALQSFVECSACGERLAFALDADAIRAGAPADPSEADGDVGGMFTMDGYAIRFRVPNSRDLAAVIDCGDAAAGRAILLRRCLLAAERDGAPVAADDLPDEIMAEVGRQMAERDPQAELLLDLTCPACAHRWDAPFDIVSFFWAEIATEAKRLLREVHTLARSYGWREADVLAMSATRRRSYLDLLDG